MPDNQFINIGGLKKNVNYCRTDKKVLYICPNMSTPLPVRLARLEWTFSFYTYE